MAAVIERESSWLSGDARSYGHGDGDAQFETGRGIGLGGGGPKTDAGRFRHSELRMPIRCPQCSESTVQQNRASAAARTLVFGSNARQGRQTGRRGRDGDGDSGVRTASNRRH